MAPDSAAIEEVRRRFYETGVTVVDWARAHEFDVHLVYGVLNGRSRARRGESHRIAVALGLKVTQDVSQATIELVPAATSSHAIDQNKEALMRK